MLENFRKFLNIKFSEDLVSGSSEFVIRLQTDGRSGILGGRTPGCKWSYYIFPLHLFAFQ